MDFDPDEASRISHGQSAVNTRLFAADFAENSGQRSVRRELVEDERLEHDRALADERARKPASAISRPSRPRSESDDRRTIDAAAGLQPLARLGEERGDVAIAGAGDARRGRRRRAARRRRRAGSTGSRRRAGAARSPEKRFEQTGKTRSARPFSRALSPAESAAFGLMSIATTRAAPARAAASERTPEPVPTSATAFPFRSSSIDEARKILAGQEIARVEDGRADDKLETRRRARFACSAAPGSGDRRRNG